MFLAPVRGLPRAPLDVEQTLIAVDLLIATAKPNCFISMNLQTAILASEQPAFWRAVKQAAGVGVPLAAVSITRARRRLGPSQGIVGAGRRPGAASAPLDAEIGGRNRPAGS
jgi:hypothetical protein